MNDLFAFFIVMSGIDLFLILYRIFVCLTFIQFYQKNRKKKYLKFFNIVIINNNTGILLLA
jgi:hypothetical protein